MIKLKFASVGIFLLSTLTLISLQESFVSGQRHQIVTYWGQNAVFNSLRERQFWEKDLVEFCRSYNYDVIILSFLNVFFDARNRDRMPGFNFAFHCGSPVSSQYPSLLRCPKIEAGIKECQRNGKKVLMSLGGAVGSYGFASESEARQFAYRVYHLLLEGNDLQSLRPFGSAILNGVDLDIEGGSSLYYTTFVRELRQLESRGSQKIVISAAPQCPFPDRLLGPSPGRVLGDVPELIDEIYIQFYNNFCHTGSQQTFYNNFRQWSDYSARTNGPAIYIGVPADTGASGRAQYYRPPNELAEIYNNLKDDPNLGGIMFWDASFDQNNIINGKHYSEHIAAMFGQQPPPTSTTTTTRSSSTTTRRTTTRPTTTRRTTTRSTSTPSTTPKITTIRTTKTTVTTKRPTLSCAGRRASGPYRHPTDCSKYFLCFFGRAYVFVCPAGLRYNESRKYCDWPYNVACY